jgi:hypothetical protein
MARNLGAVIDPQGGYLDDPPAPRFFTCLEQGSRCRTMELIKGLAVGFTDDTDGEAVPDILYGLSVIAPIAHDIHHTYQSPASEQALASREIEH